jgi:hypothetical protein
LVFENVIDPENSTHNPNHPFPLCTASQVKLQAPVAAIGVQREVCMSGSYQRVGFGRVAGFFNADA